MIPEDLPALIRRGRSFLLTSHANPDGDAIGSELGLARILEALGKRVTIWNLHPTPTVYRPLPGAAAIHSGPEPPAGFPGAFDAAIVLECPTLDRTGLEVRLQSALRLVNIDHHLGNASYGELNWVDTEAPAVGVLVADLARALGVALDVETANCLHLALVTDTGGFRFANSTPAAFDAASRLVGAGARVETVSQWLYESQPEASIRLLGELLVTLKRHGAGGRVATVYLTAAMFTKAGASAGDSEGLIDTPRSVAGVEAVAMLRELGPAEWKVSLRSRGAADVEQVARRRGGGGHRNAAGCRISGELDEVRATLAAELEAAVGAVHVD